MKKLVAIAIVAILCGAALPAGAAVTVNGSVTVKWNTSVAASLTLATNYSAAGAQQLTAPTIVTQNNTGSGACTATGAGSEVAATVNFGNITPDFAQTTGCLYQNASNAIVKTNSTNWTLTEATAAALPTGATLCALANDAGNSWPFPATGALPATQTVAAHTAASIAGTSCPASALSLTTSNSTAISSTTAYPTTAANIGEDMALLLTAANPLGANTVTVNYQVIAN